MVQKTKSYNWRNAASKKTLFWATFQKQKTASGRWIVQELCKWRTCKRFWVIACFICRPSDDPPGGIGIYYRRFWYRGWPRRSSWNGAENARGRILKLRWWYSTNGKTKWIFSIWQFRSRKLCIWSRWSRKWKYIHWQKYLLLWV